MDFDIIRRFISYADNKSFHVPFPKRNNYAAANLDRLPDLVHKGSRQRQTHRDIGVHRGLRPKAEKFGANLLHVFPDFAFFLRGTQKIGRMERCNDAHSIQIEKFPAQPRDRRDRLNHCLRGKCTEAANDLRTNRSKLFFQKWIASGNFIRFGITIFRRPAFEDVADVYIFTLEIDGLDDFRQQLARPADKRQTLLIFVIARGLADEYKFGAGISGPEDDVCALRCELAALAVADLGANGFEVL